MKVHLKRLLVEVEGGYDRPKPIWYAETPWGWLLYSHGNMCTVMDPEHEWLKEPGPAVETVCPNALDLLPAPPA